MLKIRIMIVLLSMLTVLSVNAEKLIVGVDVANPPFTFLNAEGRVVGFDVDILNAIGAVEQFEAEYVNSGWKNLDWVVALDEGRRDIWASGIMVRKENKHIAAFTDPYYQAQSALFLLEDHPRTASVAELRDMASLRIAAQNHTVGYLRAEKMYHNTVQVHDAGKVCEAIDVAHNLYPTNTTFMALKLLLQGKVDGVVSDVAVSRYLLQPYADHLGIETRHVVLPPEDDGSMVGFIVQKDNQELKKRLNDGLSVIQSNGEYERILNRWFDDDFIKEQDLPN